MSPYNCLAKTLNEVSEVVAASRVLRDEILASHSDVKIYLSGLSMMDNSFGEASLHDMTSLVPLMFMVVVIDDFISTQL